MAGISALYGGLIDSLLAEEGGAASLTLRAALEYLDSRATSDVASAGAADGAAAGTSAGAPDTDVLEALRQHFADISAMVSERLERAEARGELRLNQAPPDLALFILLNAFNLTFVVKLTRERDRLAAYVQAALDAVAGHGTRPWGASRTDA
jgi:hypothetical protein